MGQYDLSFDMKKSFLIGIGIASVGALFLSAGSIFLENVPSHVTKEQQLIAIRQIGHQLLLQAGDSTSQVLPVKELDGHVFELQFQHPLKFTTDSLIELASRSLQGSLGQQSYTVSVIKCSSNELVYGFFKGQTIETTQEPCLGREQPVDCYQIRVSFPTKLFSGTKYSYLFFLAAGTLMLVSFVGRAYTLPSKNKSVAMETGAILLGEFKFYSEQGKLIYDGNRIDLSDKEIKVLRVFSENINQSVTREQLMKAGWNDDGALISRSLDVFVSRLRKKLRADASLKLVNIHGVGYKLEILSE